MHEDIDVAREHEADSDSNADQAARRLEIAKEKLSDAKQEQMVMNSIVKDASHDAAEADGHAARTKERLDNLQIIDKAEKKARAAYAPKEWEQVGDYAMDEKGKLLHVRHERDDNAGLRSVYTMVGNRMATLKVSDSDAETLEPENFELLTAMTPGVKCVVVAVGLTSAHSTPCIPRQCRQRGLVFKPCPKGNSEGSTKGTGA